MQQRLVRFRTLGCYPFTGAVDSAAATVPEIIEEMLRGDDVGAAGAGDRPRRVGLDGAEEEGRVLLMAVEATEDIGAYLAAQERKELLRFLTAGSVDDGKSTLIGRLLYDTQLIYEDQLAAVKRDSERKGTTGGAIDLSLLMDGLKAEREQGITIDVAYRYFSTSRRKFIIADCPGHEQYTRNMATGASNCDLAIILIDARHGVQRQTRRHSFIVSLLGIRHVVVADQQDGPRRVVGVALRRDPARVHGVRHAAGHARPALHPDVGAARRQPRRAQRRTCRGTRARRCCGCWRPCTSPRTAT